MASIQFLYCLLALTALLACVEGSHFRYGTITFSKDVRNPLNVTITLNMVWRRTYFGSPNTGASITDDYFYFGDGGNVLPSFKVNSINTVDDWLSATWAVNRIYPSANTYTAYYSSCCRIGALNNNANANYRVQGVLKITPAEVAKTTPVNNSPVSGTLPIVNVPYGVTPFTYQLLAADQEDSYAFRLASASEFGGGSQPTGLSVTSAGVVTLSSVLATGFWTTQQIITDTFGNMVAVDYMLNVQSPSRYCNGLCSSSNSRTCQSNADCVSCNSSCLTAVPRIVTSDLSSSAVPRTNLPAPASGSSLTIPILQTTVISFVVDDANLINTGTPPTIFTSAVPSYGSSSTVKPCTAANGCTYIGNFQLPQFLQVSLSPTTAHYGTQQVLCVGAKSLDNPLPSQHCITININNFTAICGNGIIEGSEQCDDTGACCVACRLASAGTVCRAQNGACDVAETCSGVSTTCPADSFASGSVCRASTGPCDVAEQCSGSSASCPADSFQSSSVTCRVSSGICDVAEQCTGTSAFCPADSFQSSSVTCRASNGPCDVAEQCTGSSASCPADSFQSSSVTCRASNGDCDVAEQCTGSSASCPVDSFQSSSVTCRASAGACDVAETCDGSSASCPADSFQSSSVTCRASNGDCDVEETCDGSSASCPADSFQSSSVTCRASNGDCDVAEQCTGSSASCPVDSFQSSSVTCRASNGDCDVAEQCTGSSASCPVDSFQAPTVECRASNGVCDVAEKCDGSSASCPADSFESSSVTCRASAGACDVAEQCSGTSATCPSDSIQASGFQCRPSNGDCDVAETCDGASPSCPADSFQSSSVTCRASNGVCDVAEQCTGSSASCPVDSFKLSSTVCRSSVGVCDAAETCTGTSASCPADVMSSSTTVCRPANGTCDVAETCTGSSVNCPIDAVANTSACQTAAYVCPRVSAVQTGGQQQWYCSMADPSKYIFCYTSYWNGQQYPTWVDSPCPAGTGCRCPYGVDCSCGGMQSPCTNSGSPPVC